jgi:outer membrane protein OmpA-like peptidoglycan-associated protein
MNILSLIENQLSPQTIGPISNAIGESPAATKTALGAAVAGILGSLLGKVSASPNGATDLLGMLNKGASQGAWSDNISNIAQGMTGGAPSTNQQSLLGSLLGSKLGPVSDFISNHAGVGSGSATSLLSMAATLVMGTLSKHVASQGLSAGGLSQLLGSQIPFLKNALPSGLANTLGINNLLSGTQKIAQPTEAAYRQASPVQKTAPAAGGALKWAGVAALLALVGWLAATYSHRRTPAVGGTMETNYNATTGRGYSSETNLSPTGRGYGNYDMSSLHLAPGGAAYNVANAISSGDWNKTVDLQGFNTDSSGALTDSAKASVGELGKVLSTAPDVKVRITGHGATDESGLNEANSIKSALVATRISEDRISTSGQAGTGSPTLNLVHAPPSP